MAASPRNFVAGVLPMWMATAGATRFALEKAAALMRLATLVFFVFMAEVSEDPVLRESRPLPTRVVGVGLQVCLHSSRGGSTIKLLGKSKRHIRGSFMNSQRDKQGAGEVDAGRRKLLGAVGAGALVSSIPVAFAAD